jgi:hypothetical protein
MHQLHEDTLRADDVIMLVKVGHSARWADDADDVYEHARKWWKASPVAARRARRVLAVAGGRVVAAYLPDWWEISDEPETQGRIAFHGVPAPDAAAFVGRPVAHLWPRGASNPVRYSTPAALAPDKHEGQPRPSSSSAELTPAENALLLRINQSWHPDMSAAELFEATRGFWVMSPTRAESVVRAFAVAHGIVREVYAPVAWSPSPTPGEEHRVGFDGNVADDRDRWVGLDVSAVFPHGSQNPVRYVDLDDLTAVPSAHAQDHVATRLEVRGSEPGLAEQVNPLLEAFDDDLLWSMSRAAQELFHSNTLSWLMWRHPVAAAPLRAVFEGPEPFHKLEVWREWKHIDLVARRSDGRARFVVENKLYSVPYAAQLESYASVDLPWSKDHGAQGARDTAYYLLALMDPTFDLPPPWQRVSYEQVLRALVVCDAQRFGSDADLFDRYRSLVRRLVELKDAVDPRKDLDGPFSVTAALGKLHHKSFTGPLQRMRFTGLAQAISEEHGSPLSLEVDVSRSKGLITYFRELSETRTIGWQFQEAQLRLFVLVQDEGLAGKGSERAAARAKVADAEYDGLVDFATAEAVLGDLLQPKTFVPGTWQRFAPDFVYRYRKVDEQTTTRQLAQALANLTAYVDAWRTSDHRAAN